MAATQTINGFQCRNCTDIDYAKKHIDPADPKDGPYGINAKDGKHADGVTPDPAVTLAPSLLSVRTDGGNLTSTGNTEATPFSTSDSSNLAPGSLFDLKA